jgi:predicted permease
VENIIDTTVYHLIGGLCIFGIVYSLVCLKQILKNQNLKHKWLLFPSGILCCAFAWLLLIIIDSKSRNLFLHPEDFLIRCYLIMILTCVIILCIAFICWLITRNKSAIKGMIAVATFVNMLIIGHPFFYQWCKYIFK